MGNWDYDDKPNWIPDQENLYRTERGWEYEHANGLREVVVACRQLEEKGNVQHDVQTDNLTLGDGFDLLLAPYVPGGQLPQLLNLE